MNSTLSTSQEYALLGHPPQAAPVPRTAHAHVQAVAPSADALRHLPLVHRVQLRLALWLLERTPNPVDAKAEVAVVAASDALNVARERMLAVREARDARAAHDAMRQYYQTVPRAL